MELLLMHSRWFPRQLQQFLQALGRQVGALLIAVGMPILLWLGLGEPLGCAKALLAIRTQKLLANLTEVGRPAESYQEVPQRISSSRRGLWEEICPGAQIEQFHEQLTATKPLPNSALLPNVDLSQLQTGSMHSYQTILPTLNLPDLNRADRI